MNTSEKLKQAQLQKEKGTKYFTCNKLSLAVKVYYKVFTYLDAEPDFTDNDKIERDNIALATHLNLALCHLKIENYLSAKDECTKALSIDPKNEKAYFRRGQAYLGLASPEIAIKDFQEVLNIEPKNTAASKQIIICNRLIKQQLSKEKKLYANMFDKFAQEDKQVCG